MKAARVLVLSALGFLMALSPAKPQEEVVHAERAADGLQAIGNFIQWIAEPRDEVSQMTAFATFIKNLIKMVGEDPEFNEKINAFINKAMQLSQERMQLREEMKTIAAAIDAGVSAEEDAKLRARMRQLLEKDLEVIKNISSSTTQMDGYTKGPTDSTTEAFNSALFSLIHAFDSTPFSKYL